MTVGSNRMQRRTILLGITAAGVVGTSTTTSSAADKPSSRGQVDVMISMQDLRRGLPEAAGIQSYDGRVVLLAGYHQALDGGEGFFFWDDRCSDDDDGGITIQVHAVPRGRWRRLGVHNTVNARWFGAQGDGESDDAKAIQSAVDACQRLGLGVLEIPAGRYMISGSSTQDPMLTGIIVPESAPTKGLTDALQIVGCGRATTLAAKQQNMIMLRCTGSNAVIRDLTLDGRRERNVWGIGCVPSDMTQTSRRVFQSYNRFEGLLIRDCSEAVVQTPGPTTDFTSGSYYNAYRDIHIYNCIRGIWLKMGVAERNLNNRNFFENIRIGGHQRTNTGIQVDAGDTNTFMACHFEGIISREGPSAPPTGLVIREYGGSAWNQKNTFISCVFESNARDIDNSNATTTFIACSYKT